MAGTLKIETLVTELHENVGSKKIGIVASKWHHAIIEKLIAGAKSTLVKAGIEKDNILVHYVPGSFELPLGAQMLVEHAHADAVICLGCIVKGETPHFHYIAETVSMHISQLALRYNKPVSFGVLTVDNVEQASERAGGNYGNKGEEAAQAALEMLSLKESLKTKKSKTSIGFGAPPTK